MKKIEVDEERCINELDEQELQEGLKLLKRQVWMDFFKEVLGNDMICSIGEQKLFDIKNSKNWTLSDLKEYLLMHYKELLEDNYE